MLGIGMQHQKDPNGIAWRQQRDFDNLLRRLNGGTDAPGPFHKARAEEGDESFKGGEEKSAGETRKVDGGADNEEEEGVVKRKEKKRKKRKNADESEEGIDGRKRRKKRKKSKEDGDGDHAVPDT